GAGGVAADGLVRRPLSGAAPGFRRSAAAEPHAAPRCPGTAASPVCLPCPGGLPGDGVPPLSPGFAAFLPQPVFTGFEAGKQDKSAMEDFPWRKPCAPLLREAALSSSSGRSSSLAFTFFLSRPRLPSG